jgi:hypothetical protein
VVPEDRGVKGGYTLALYRFILVVVRKSVNEKSLAVSSSIGNALRGVPGWSVALRNLPGTPRRALPTETLLNRGIPGIIAAVLLGKLPGIQTPSVKLLTRLP